MKYKKADAKEWARGFFRGLEATILPSFTPDQLALDEAAIRHDVRELIKHGFFSAVTVTDTGTTREEDKLFIQWCVDEAKGKIGIGSCLRYPTLKENMEMAKFAEEVGCDTIFLCYPPNFHPKTMDEVFDYTLAVCQATNLAAELFPSHKYDFPFPSSFPPSLLKRMAEIENVVAMKIGVIEYAWMDECFRLFGDKILISHPFDEGWPIFIRKYGMQWSGSAPWQIFQTPDDPRQVRLFNLIQEDRMDEAMELYWKMDPLRTYFMHAMQSLIGKVGIYNYQMWKYMEGLVGMSGGEMRYPKAQFLERDKKRARNAMLASGLKIVEWR
ncbi:MAG: dihydrodipicolinate synthase family protein [Desulfobacterales bacterium]|nr:MAG: dihydrodipicolinate synthase family protein [Desulfobacterales bacterium]